MTILDLFVDAPEQQAYAADSVIFQEGDAGSAMYVVMDGEVDVMIHGNVVETIGAGGVFGEMALIDAGRRSATVLAKTSCRLVPIDESSFLSLIRQKPDFALAVMRQLAGRLRRMDDHV